MSRARVLSTTAVAEPPDQLVPDPVVAREFGIR